MGMCLKGRSWRSTRGLLGSRRKAVEGGESEGEAVSCFTLCTAELNLQQEQRWHIIPPSATAYKHGYPRVPFLTLLSFVHQ